MKFRIICAGVLLVGSTPALADWQYTKWGMTPRQVVAASKGKAVLGTGNAADKVDDEEIGAVGTYSNSAGKFSTTFYFRGGKLDQINLNLQGDDRERRCTIILSDLKSAYGQPDVSSTDEIINWKDYRGKNIVRLISLGDMCNIHYEQSGAHNLSL